MKLLEHQQQAGAVDTAAMPEILEMAWRRKWLIIGCVMVALLVAGAYCILAPKQYRSETLILVEDQQIADLQGLAEGNLEQRIFLIQKQMTSRAILGDLVNEFQLYPDVVERYGLDGGTAMLAQAVLVEMVGKRPRGNFVGRGGIDAFTVSFAHQDPVIAMQVTGKLANKFIEENWKARERVAEGSTEFFDAEVRRAKAELERKEDRISQFKAAHTGELPQQVEANLRALDRLQGDLNATNENLQRQSDRLTMLDNAVREYEKYGTKNPTLAPGPTGLDPLFPRFKELQDRLVKLQAEFYESYPEVLLTREELRQVEKKLVELYGPDVFKAGEQLVDPYVRDLKRQREEVKSEVALSQQRQALLLAEKRNYEKRIDRAPDVEQELLILERDYENMRNNYRALLDKRLNASVTENLEKRQKGAQFHIVDAANFPTKPEKPNQPRILIFGLLVGCAGGFGLALMRERLHPPFRRPEEVEVLFGPQLLAVIPDFSFERDRVRWYNRIGWRPQLSRNGAGDEAAGEVAETNGFKGSRAHRQPSEDNFIVKLLPSSTVAEQYRVAATRLSLVRTDGGSAVVAVTSAIKGEGKTTTVINLGYTMARDLGKRTLLLDCDFKCPKLHLYADAPPRFGLADCLIGEVQLDDCLAGFSDVPCSIMPVGNSSVHSSELLKSARLSGILTKLRERFEYIFINTPPILPLAAMNILAGHADMLVVVVKGNATPKQVVQRALSSLPSHAPAHVILNAVGNQVLTSYMGSYEYLAQ